MSHFPDAFREFELESVQKAAGLYDKLLPAGLKRPVIPDGHLSSWAQYTIRLDNEERRDRLAGYLRQFDNDVVEISPKLHAFLP